MCDSTTLSSRSFPLPGLYPGSTLFTMIQLHICDHLLLKFILMSSWQKWCLFLSKWKLFSSVNCFSWWLPGDRECHLYPSCLSSGVILDTSLPGLPRQAASPTPDLQLFQPLSINPSSSLHPLHTPVDSNNSTQTFPFKLLILLPNQFSESSAWDNLVQTV